MAQEGARVKVEGSERELLPNSRPAGPPDPDRVVDVTVAVRRGPAQVPPEAAAGAHLTREAFAARHGAAPEDLEAVEAFARDHGLRVVESSPARRAVVLSGTIAALSVAFGVDLQLYDSDAGRYRGREGAVYVPGPLQGIVEGVFGLDDRPQVRPHVRVAPDAPAPAAAAKRSFDLRALKQLYRFPPGATGAAQTIGIVEFGGGFLESDLRAFFGQLGLAEPHVVVASVDGGRNSPNPANNDPTKNPDFEVTLDIEVAGAAAPGATLVVYFAPNGSRGVFDAYSQAIHDTVNRPTVISTSWGSAESGHTGQALRTLDQLFQDAAAMGVTICAAAGDNGSSDGVDDGRLHVDFPASSPHVLGCGGTTLTAANGTIASEVVWNHDGGATGGGISEQFALPTWQQRKGVPPSANPGRRPGRGVPDVSGDADPDTGYNCLVHGRPASMGGTSAVAPLWAGLVALLNQRLGRNLGLVNPQLYGLTAQTAAFHDITSGNNDATGAVPARPYAATRGWDPCTGLGSPDGSSILAGLGGGGGGTPPPGRP